MQPLKPPKPSVPPPPSLPPPAPLPGAAAGRVPSPLSPVTSAPPPSVPPPSGQRAAAPPASVPPPAPAAASSYPPPQAAPAAPVEVAPEAADGFREEDLISDEAISEVLDSVAPDPNQKSSFISKLRVLPHKGTYAVWIVAAGIGFVIVAQRAGWLQGVAAAIGQEEPYVQQEQQLLGGPGQYTEQNAEKLWKEHIDPKTYPFSAADKQPPGEQTEAKSSAKD